MGRLQHRQYLEIEIVMKLLFIFLFLLSVVSCSSNPATVSDRSQPPSIRITNHKVDVGETLYSIAWRYDLNVKDLANANRLGPSDIINPGQILTLVVSGGKPSAGRSRTYKVSSGDTLFSIAYKYGVSVPRLARINNLAPPYTINRDQILTLDGPTGSVNQNEVVSSSNSSIKSVRKTKVRPTNNSDVKEIAYTKNWQWQWPLQGTVTEKFNLERLQKGLKIKGQSNAKVSPAAPGNVVYAGSGLRGYGNLIIIKHSDVLLSAYANNEKVFVDVGQSVTQADTISTLGADGSMYFEIRKDGNPVDPLKFLK